MGSGRSLLGLFSGANFGALTIMAPEAPNTFRIGARGGSEEDGSAELMSGAVSTVLLPVAVATRGSCAAGVADPTAFAPLLSTGFATDLREALRLGVDVTLFLLAEPFSFEGVFPDRERPFFFEDFSFLGAERGFLTIQIL